MNIFLATFRLMWEHKRISAAILIPFALFMYVSTAGFYHNSSDGFRVGVIQKASYKGLLFKSYEGELVQEGFKNTITPAGNGNLNNTWEFSALDPDIIKQLEKYAGQKVRIYYNQWLIKPMRQNTSYTVLRVEETK